MTPESKAFFDALLPPTGRDSSVLTDDLYAAVEPFHLIAAQFATRIAELRLLLARADRAEGDVAVYAKFERFKQTLGALERELAALTHAGSAATDAAYQLDRYAFEVAAEVALADPAP
jgi:hypothetical protein